MSQTARGWNSRWWLLLFWVAITVAGFGRFLNYATTSGDAGKSEVCWPDGSKLVQDTARPTVILFLHPHCPCSTASLDELAHVVTRCPERAAIYALFCRPEVCPPGWEKTSMWHQAEAIPGVEVRTDGGGVEARRFGVNTSGHVLLFDAAGRLCFSGGITRARGHRGENAGRDAVIAWLTGQSSALQKTPIFGCALHD